MPVAPGRTRAGACSSRAIAAAQPIAETGAGVAMVDVSRSADAYPALHRAQLRLPWGRITAFTGPVDSGATTLLALIATQLAPHSGELFVAGHHTIRATRRARACLGRIPREPVDWGRLPVRDVLATMAAAQGVDAPTSRARVEELLGATGLLPHAGSPSADLTVPQRRLLTLAGALVHGPRVVVLDEPLAGLDPAERADLVALLRELAGCGMTLAFGANRADELHDVADRVVEMEAGRLVASHDLTRQVRAVRWRIVSSDAAALRAGLTRWGLEPEDVGESAAGQQHAAGGAGASIVEVCLNQERDAADLLAALVQAGVPVQAFLPPQPVSPPRAWPASPAAEGRR